MVFSEFRFDDVEKSSLMLFSTFFYSRSLHQHEIANQILFRHISPLARFFLPMAYDAGGLFLLEP